MSDQPLKVTRLLSNTSDFTDLPKLKDVRNSDLIVVFDAMPGASGNRFRVTVTVLGELEDHGGFFEGWTEYSPEDAEEKIRAIREFWHTEVLDYEPANPAASRRPYLTDWDASNTISEADFDSMGLKLAQIGAELFEWLFEYGDNDLQVIGRYLRTALEVPGKIVTIRSDALHAPWQLLYVQPPDLGALNGPAGAWAPEGFLGIGHLIGHVYKRVNNWKAQILVGESGAKFGAYVDRRLDDGPRPCVYPVIQYFEDHGSVELFESRDEVSWSMRQGPSHDVIYVNCHAELGVEGVHPPEYALTDGKKFTALDIGQWLHNRSLPNAVVFMATCHGGRIRNAAGAAMGVHMLRAGANSLIGPHLELPVALVPTYVMGLFDALRTGERLGDAVRSFALKLIQENRNPLGLSIGLIRGLETRFIGWR